MTIDDIEGMSDETYAAMSPDAKREVARLILQELERDGIAYKGEDGRYRMRENVTYLGDGNAMAGPLN